MGYFQLPITLTQLTGVTTPNTSTRQYLSVLNGTLGYAGVSTESVTNNFTSGLNIDAFVLFTTSDAENSSTSTSRSGQSFSYRGILRLSNDGSTETLSIYVIKTNLSTDAESTYSETGVVQGDFDSIESDPNSVTYTTVGE